MTPGGLHRLPTIAEVDCRIAATKGGINRQLPRRLRGPAAKFKAANDKMVAEVAKLETAAKSGSLDAIKAAMGAVGGSCKACHDDFRAEKYSN